MKILAPVFLSFLPAHVVEVHEVQEKNKRRTAMDAGEKMNQMAEKQNCCVKYNGRHVPRKNPAQMNLMQKENVVKMYAFVASTPFGWKQNTYARAKCDADKDSNQKLVEAGPKLEPRATQDRSLSLHGTFKHVSSHGSKRSGQPPRLARFHLPKSRPAKFWWSLFAPVRWPPFILNHGTISFILLVLLLTVPGRSILRSEVNNSQ